MGSDLLQYVDDFDDLFIFQFVEIALGPINCDLFVECDHTRRKILVP